MMLKPSRRIQELFAVSLNVKWKFFQSTKVQQIAKENRNASP